MSIFLFAVLRAIIGAAPFLPLIIICRFATGVLTAISAVVLAGSIEDTFKTGSRIWLVYAWSVSENLGFCASHVIGAYVTAELS